MNFQDDKTTRFPDIKKRNDIVLEPNFVEQRTLINKILNLLPSEAVCQELLERKNNCCFANISLNDPLQNPEKRCDGRNKIPVDINVKNDSITPPLNNGRKKNKRPFETKADNDLSSVLFSLREAHRQREDLLRARTALTNRIKAICRRLSADDEINTRLHSSDEKIRQKAFKEVVKRAGVLYDDMDTRTLLIVKPFLEARDPLDVEIKKREKFMVKECWPQLPENFRRWVEDVKGFGVPSACQVLAELGDPSAYANPAKIFKRMGLAVIDGERQRRVANDPGKAIVHAYCPRRRSLMFVVTDTLIRAKNPRYRAIYDAAKTSRLERGWNKKRAHLHATRVMARKLLLALWLVWNGQELKG